MRAGVGWLGNMHRDIWAFHEVARSSKTVWQQPEHQFVQAQAALAQITLSSYKTKGTRNWQILPPIQDALCSGHSAAHTERGNHKTYLLGAVPFVPEALWGGVCGKAVLMDVPRVVRGAPLLPKPVEVAAQKDRDEEQLRLSRIFCPDAALQQMLVEQLHAIASAVSSCFDGNRADPDLGLVSSPGFAEGARETSARQLQQSANGTKALDSYADGRRVTE